MSTQNNRRYRGSFHRNVYSDAQWNLIVSATEPRVGISASERPLPRPPSSRRRSILSFSPRRERHIRPLPMRPLPKPPVPAKDFAPKLISAKTPASGDLSPPPVPPKDRHRSFVLPSFLAPITNNTPPPTRYPPRRLSRRISLSPFRRVLRLAKHIRPLFPVQSPKR